jgi:hypothetical protein
MRYLRRTLDAALLLVAASNLHHLLSVAARLHNSRRGLRDVSVDADTISALLRERGNTHGL